MSAIVSLRADAPVSAIRPPKVHLGAIATFKRILAARHCTGIAHTLPEDFGGEPLNLIFQDLWRML
jgi:hypothetical protein